MSATLIEKPRRILVIDDNDAIHGDFRKTLVREDIVPASLSIRQGGGCFAESASPDAAKGVMPKFEIQSAMQGQEGLEKLQDAYREGRPLPCGIRGHADAAGLGQHTDHPAL